LAGVFAASGVVYDDGVLRIARIEPPPLGLLLTGEADETGYQPLVAALAQLAGGHGSPAEVHLDLSGLVFCDVACLHAMIELTGDGSRVLVLHNPPAPLQALIRITGWDEVPGLTVENGPLPSVPVPPSATSPAKAAHDRGDATR
jgi:ABC-type transporter Mla MlaB component